MMSNSALTVPGKWSSYNSSTVQHAMTRHSSFKSPRYESHKETSLSHAFDNQCLTVKNKTSNQSIENKYPLLHFSNGESSTDKTLKSNTLTLPKLVGKSSVLNRVYAASGQQQHVTEEKMTDNYTTNNIGVRVPGSLSR